ncbi:nuclear distribution protein nudE-like 1-B [Symsagittifera roscoffensis]|uniref:nuclear distribution protein nudE-like 1-B n=1 Tax=Symsagittifera roscoffensis TaxID=84072 RepID=UPI00307B2F5C
MANGEGENSELSWKSKAELLERKYQELKEEYSNLEQTSKEVESELEDFTRVLEDQNSKLNSENTRIKTDLEKLRQRYGEVQKENNELIGIRDRQEVKLGELGERVRHLENENDSLIQSERRANYTIETLRDELESHLLRLCSLEEEVIQKDQLSEALQRMKDEFRDMEQEIKVQKLKSSASASILDASTNNNNTSQHLSNNTTAASHVKQDSTLSNGSIHNNNTINNNNTIMNGVKKESSEHNGVSTTPSTLPRSRMGSVSIKTEPTTPLGGSNLQMYQFPPRAGNTTSSALSTNGVYSTNHEKGDLAQQQPPTAKVHPIKKSMNQTHHHSQQGQSMSMRHSSRSQALQIVSDLLRKVSNLESKLESCRMYSVAIPTGATNTNNGLQTIGDGINQSDAVSEFVHSTEGASLNDQIRYY